MLMLKNGKSNNERYLPLGINTIDTVQFSSALWPL